MATKRPTIKRDLKTVRTTFNPPSGVLPAGQQHELEVVSDVVTKAKIELQARDQQHEHRSIRYREIFTYAALFVILVIGLVWASNLEKSLLAEFGKVIVNSIVVAAIAYVFSSNSKT